MGFLDKSCTSVLRARIETHKVLFKSSVPSLSPPLVLPLSILLQFLFVYLFCIRENAFLKCCISFIHYQMS